MARKRQTTPLPKAPATRGVKKTIQPTRVDRLLGRDPNREQTHAERDAAIQRVIILAVGGAALIIAVALVVAFVADSVIRPSQAVATIDGQTISVGEYQKRVRIERGIHIMLMNDVLNDVMEQNDVSIDDAGNFVLQQEPYATWWSELNTPDVMGLRVLDDMVDDRLIEKAAAELGVSVTDEDVQNYINKLIGYDPEKVALIGVDPTATPEPTSTPTPFVSPTPSPSPTPTTEPTETPTVEGTVVEGTPVEGATAESPTATVEATATATSTTAPTVAVPTLSATEVQGNFETQKRGFVSEIASMAGASQDEVSAVLRGRALRAAVADHLTASEETETEADETTLYADVRHILVETEEEALDIIDALNAGDSFADLAKAVSTDTGSGANGGELDWAPVSNYVEPFANAVRSAEIGAFVGPVESEFGFHIIQVRAKENREADQSQIDRAKDLALTAWVDEVRTNAEGTFSTTNAWANNIPSSPLWRFIER